MPRDSSGLTRGFAVWGLDRSFAQDGLTTGTIEELRRAVTKVWASGCILGASSKIRGFFAALRMTVYLGWGRS
jgi:hypothetical protein